MLCVGERIVHSGPISPPFRARLGVPISVSGELRTARGSTLIRAALGGCCSGSERSGASNADSSESVSDARLSELNPGWDLLRGIAARFASSTDGSALRTLVLSRSRLLRGDVRGEDFGDARCVGRGGDGGGDAYSRGRREDNLGTLSSGGLMSEEYSGKLRSTKSNLSNAADQSGSGSGCDTGGATSLGDLDSSCDSTDGETYGSLPRTTVTVDTARRCVAGRACMRSASRRPSVSWRRSVSHELSASWRRSVLRLVSASRRRSVSRLFSPSRRLPEYASELDMVSPTCWLELPIGIPSRFGSMLASISSLRAAVALTVLLRGADGIDGRATVVPDESLSAAGE